MMRHFTIFLLGFLLSATGMGQDNTFTVLAVKGKVTFNREVVKTGDVLRGAGEFNLGEGAYLGLIHRSGKPVEVQGAGVYKASDLGTRAAEGEGNFSEQFAAYMADEMQSDDGVYQQQMGVTGSVERAVRKHGILLTSPGKSTLIQPELTFHWMDTIHGQYDLILMNMHEEVLERQTTNDHRLTINVSDLDLESRQYYIVEVRSADRVSNRVHLYVPSRKEREALQEKALEALQPGHCTNAVSCIATARFLAGLNMHVEAADHFSKAVAFNKNVAPVFEEYLWENGVK